MIAGDIAVAGAAPLPLGVVRRAVVATLAGERRTAAMSITFLTRGGMQSLNATYKGHDRPTDVIAFTLPQPDGAVVGDVYICRGVAAQEARARGIPVRTELIRLLVHGTLHVLGWEHPDTAARERSDMWRRQERYVKALT